MTDFNSNSMDAQFATVLATMLSNQSQANEFRSLICQKIDGVKAIVDTSVDKQDRVERRVTVLESDHKKNTETLTLFVTKFSDQSEELQKHKNFMRGVIFICGGLVSLALFIIVNREAVNYLLHR